MTFNPGIPQSSDIPSQSQSQILTNFSQLNTIFGNNHYEFNNATVANRGKHKFVSMPAQGSDPATSSSEMALYTKIVSGNTELFVRRESNGTVVQLTGPASTTIPAQNGSVFIDGGVIMKWGFPGVVNDNTVVNFVSAFPSNCWNVQLTIIDPNATSRTVNLKTASLTTTSFTVRVSSAVSVYYIAIGN